MRKISLYLETSVWNFLFADDSPDKKAQTERFFNNLASGDFELYISEMVIKEIAKAPDQIRTKLFGAIKEYAPAELEITGKTDALAAKYAEANILPEKAYEDLIHAASATVNGMDFLVSWNLKHIANAKTMVGINEVNKREGYDDLKICTVIEVTGDE